MIPLLPVAAGLYGVSQLFKKRPSFDYSIPDYFGSEYKNLLATVRQASEAQYGGGLNDIREALANQGMLGSSALPNAITQFDIAKGRDVLGAEAALGGEQLQSKQAAELERNRLKATAGYQADVGARESELGLLSSLAGSLGSYYAGKGAAKKTGGATDAGTTGTPSDKYLMLSDGTFVENPQYKTRTRKILQQLLGF